MQPKFCPKCGKKTSELTENLCFKCFTKGLKLIKIPERLEVEVCMCRSFLDKGKWIKYKDFDEVVEHMVYKNIKTIKGTFIRIKYKKKEIIGKTIIPLELTGELDINSRRLIEKKSVELIVKPLPCNICSRMSGNYYEVIIQLRTSFNKKLEKFIENKVKNDKMNFITKIEELKIGIDMYLGSKNSTIGIVNECKRLYNLKIKKSYKLHGEKKGKKQYRITIALKE